ncbi:hypothetical protein OX283_009485 [Flavobacterium sp. SUN052]|uniref:hypothetical protein n=1 Tax=Flavobacterium sp. SUN052 TaxID=3002441 RepID=UPI00237E633C|nr:hypothetical protein [Flavobacterium sp. SUN052]MEC4004886.1 hypothetical protein [Flavobacterium sp. SUN052]
MYKGFNLELNFEEYSQFEEYYKIGLSNYLKIQKPIQKTLSSFIYPDKGIDGTKLEQNWFPKFETEIFISYSHKDKKNAIALSGWLFEKHNITSFVDSCLWGYSKTLLRSINNDYSWLDQSKNIYSYEKANYASSHIHMMLSNALSLMIDKSECFILINTPDSIKAYKDVDKTESPWIYSEIFMSKLLIGKKPDRFIERIYESTETFSKGGLGIPNLRIDYNIDISHLIKIEFDSLLKKWGNKNYKDKYVALDNLYNLK